METSRRRTGTRSSTGKPPRRRMDPLPHHHGKILRHLKDGTGCDPCARTRSHFFRYSALTFNSHRIHYDHPYVTGVEGYPGLVTHGPLTATLLLDAFMKNHPEATVATYDFRAKSPLFANEQIHLVGRSTGTNTHELEAIGPEGKTAIAATVTTTES